MRHRTKVPTRSGSLLSVTTSVSRFFGQAWRGGLLYLKKEGLPSLISACRCSSTVESGASGCWLKNSLKRSTAFTQMESRASCATCTLGDQNSFEKRWDESTKTLYGERSVQHIEIPAP